MKKSAATTQPVKFSIDVSLEGEGGFSAVRIEADSATERAEAHAVLGELAYPMDTQTAEHVGAELTKIGLKSVEVVPKPERWQCHIIRTTDGFS